MKKLLVIFMSVIMMFAFASCGGSDSGDSKEKGGDTEKKTELKVESKNGYISVTSYLDGFEAKVADDDEIIRLETPEEDDPDTMKTDCFIKLQTVKKEDGSMFGVNSKLKSFAAGQPYTEDTLKADLQAFAAEYPDIFTEITEVTIGDLTYQRCSVTTNGAASYEYYGVVDDKLVLMQVVGDDLIDSDDAMKTLESVKWSFN